MSLVIINSAVDSLYFSYKCELDPGFFKYLERLKVYAQEKEEEIAFDIGGVDIVIKPYGTRMFRYLLRSKDFIVTINPSKDSPTIMFQMLAIALYENGHSNAFRKADAIFRSIGDIGTANISRIDLCVDFQNWQINDDRFHDFICRANKKGVWYDGQAANGFQFGKGDITARIYNKTKEINISNKDWMKAIWKKCPAYDQDKEVWRVEFQFRRSALKEFDIYSVADAFGKLAGLWKYGINNWLSLRAGKATRIERRPVDKNWLALLNAKFYGSSVTRVREQKALGDIKRAIAQITGYTSSLGAVWNITSVDKILAAIKPEINRYCQLKEASFEEMVQKKRELLKYEQIK